eukprot:746120-Hanusia_phi.AAC.1
MAGIMCDKGSASMLLGVLLLCCCGGDGDGGCGKLVQAKQQHQTHKLLVDVVLSGHGIFLPGAQTEADKLQVRLMLGPLDDVGLMVNQLCEERRLSEEGCEAVASLVGQRFSDYQDSVRGRIAALPFDDGFQKLFRMKTSFPSFPELADAAFSSDVFQGIGDWWRYHEMLGDAFIEEADLSLFSEEPIFHFTCPYWTWGDPEVTCSLLSRSLLPLLTLLQAAHLAGNISASISAALFSVGDAQLGYRLGALPNHANGKLPTTNTCRHAMQLSLLIKALLADGVHPSSLRVCGWGKGLR